MSEKVKIDKMDESKENAKKKQDYGNACKRRYLNKKVNEKFSKKNIARTDAFPAGQPMRGTGSGLRESRLLWTTDKEGGVKERLFYGYFFAFRSLVFICIFI